MRDRGFALFELFSVIALLSLVAMVAIPSIINAREAEKTERFYHAVKATFTEAFEQIENNEDLATKEGEIDCSYFEYEDKKVFESCKINWKKEDPIIDDLKISVEAKEIEITYDNKTREEINILTEN